MDRMNEIIKALSAALSLLDNEIQCVEDECLAEEYQEVIDLLERSLKTAEEMSNP